MATAAELVFAEQFGHLRQVAESRGWDLTQTDGPGFILGLPARDGSRFALQVTCENFPGTPPIWRWCNPETHIPDQLLDMPRGSGGYFHNSGRICAPWNRIAYSQVDPQGPHSDWQLENWMTNPKTGCCTTLPAMALRLAVELMSARYQGRKG